MLYKYYVNQGVRTTTELWETFAERYEQWSVGDFKKLDTDTLDGLRQVLRSHGVYVKRQERFSKAQALYDAAQAQKAPLQAPEDDVDFVESGIQQQHQRAATMEPSIDPRAQAALPAIAPQPAPQPASQPAMNPNPYSPPPENARSSVYPIEPRSSAYPNPNPPSNAYSYPNPPPNAYRALTTTAESLLRDAQLGAENSMQSDYSRQIITMAKLHLDGDKHSRDKQQIQRLWPILTEFAQGGYLLHAQIPIYTDQASR